MKIFGEPIPMTAARGYWY